MVDPHDEDSFSLDEIVNHVASASEWHHQLPSIAAITEQPTAIRTSGNTKTRIPNRLGGFPGSIGILLIEVFEMSSKIQQCIRRPN
jgi:hypothetical protein